MDSESNLAPKSTYADHEILPIANYIHSCIKSNDLHNGMQHANILKLRMALKKEEEEEHPCRNNSKRLYIKENISTDPDITSNGNL